MTEEFRINISASDNTNTAFASAERRLAGLSAAASTASSALNAIGVTVGAGAFVGFIKHSIDAADELSKLSQKTGISIETLSGLKFAADQSGTSLNGVALGVKKLATFVADAEDGNRQYQATLKALGITAKDPEKALVQLAAAFERMPDGLRKTALAQDLLGKSGIELIPLLNGGADGLQRMIDRGRELNPITAQMAKEAEAFNDQLDELKASATAAGVSIAKDLLPSILSLTNGLVTMQRSGTSFFTWMTTGGDEEKNAAARIDELSASLERMKKQREELSKPTVANKINDFVFGDVKDLNAQIQATEAKIAYLKNLKKTQDAFAEDAAKKKTPLDVSSLNTGNDAAAAAKAAAQRDASAIQSLRDRLTATQNLTEVEKAGQEIASGRYKDLSVAAKRSLLEIAAQIDANKDLNETQKQQQATEKQNSEEGIARFKALQEAGASVYQSTRTDAQKYSDEVIRLNDLLAQGAITQDTYNQAVLSAQDAYQKASDKAKQTGQEMSQYAIQAARNQQTAFAQFLFDPFQDGLDGMAAGFLNAIRQMAANAAAAHIFDSLFGKSGGDGGLLGSLFSSAAGAFTGAKKFASGGDFGGGLRLVGEQGPELEVTGPSKIFNAQQTKSMLSGGGGDNITLNLTIQAGVSQTVRAEVISMIPAIKKEVIAGVANAKKRGGRLGASLS